MTLDDRKKRTHNSVAKKLYDLMESKRSNLILSLDVTRGRDFFDILERVAPHIIMVKTHIDTMHGFDAEFIKRLISLKEKHSFLIFEDRKFADIGNTVKLQYTKGVFQIIEWADLVTAHIFPGPGAIVALRKAWKETRYERGLVILPQMTSEGNLFSPEVRDRALEIAKEYCDFVIGFIGASQGDGSLSLIRERAWPEFLIFVPGVNIQKQKDELSQTYIAPEMAIREGGDIIIVGRGIYEDEAPERASVEYKERAWSELMKREQSS